MNFKDIDDDKAKSHLLGRIMALEAAVCTLITASAHSQEIASAIRADLQAVLGLGLFQPVQDALLQGVDSSCRVILKGASNQPSDPQKPA
jgi:hypothetical protein